MKPKKTHEEIIAYAEDAEQKFDLMRDTEHQELWYSIWYYLATMKDRLTILGSMSDVVAYYGKQTPIIKIGEEYYAVKDYVMKDEAWRCLKVAFYEPAGSWICCDDDNYIINAKKEILYKEVGWDLQKVFLREK